MSMTDRRGLPVAAHSAAEIASLDSYTDRLLRIDRGAEAILEDTKSFPDTAMIQLAAASFCLFGQSKPAEDAARGFLAATEPLLAHAGERERRYHQLLTLWAERDHLGALAAAEDITRRWPHDMLGAKIAEFFYYVLGQQHEGPRFLRHMDRLADANATDPDFLAMRAFAQELCGDVAAARQTVDRALQIEPRNPWAHHCVAHIHLRLGDADEAIRVLESYMPLWITAGRFAHCHNSWHLALAHLETLNRERAVELFRRHVWGFTPDYVFEQVDAIALLWRLEMAGADVSHLWAPIADRAEAHLGTHYMPFLDAHYVYALTRAGRSNAAAQWMLQVGERVRQQDDEAKRSWTLVGQNVVEACAAFARGDTAKSAKLLDPVIKDVTLTGGSDAQVDLFRQTYFHSLVQSGRKSDAKAYLQTQLGTRPRSELDRYREGLAA